jgi:hypothetical protein
MSKWAPAYQEHSVHKKTLLKVDSNASDESLLLKIFEFKNKEAIR